jgi:uncharacterized protein (TIGR02246 family)
MMKFKTAQSVGQSSKAKYIFLLSFVFVLFSTTGCTSQESDRLTEERKAEIADSLRASIEDGNKAWENLDAESYLEYFGKNSTFIYQGSILPYEKYRNLVKGYMKGIKKFDIEVVDSVDVKVLEPDVTLYSFRYKATVIDAKGDTINMNSVISGVGERKGGEWKVVHSHETTSTR